MPAGKASQPWISCTVVTPRPTSSSPPSARGQVTIEAREIVATGSAPVGADRTLGSSESSPDASSIAWLPFCKFLSLTADRAIKSRMLRSV